MPLFASNALVEIEKPHYRPPRCAISIRRGQINYHCIIFSTCISNALQNASVRPLQYISAPRIECRHHHHPNNRPTPQADTTIAQSLPFTILEPALLHHFPSLFISCLFLQWRSQLRPPFATCCLSLSCWACAARLSSTSQLPAPLL